MKDPIMKSIYQPAGWGVVTLFSLALFLTLILPIEALSQKNTTPTTGIVFLVQAPEIPDTSNLPIKTKLIVQSEAQTSQPDANVLSLSSNLDLCTSGGVYVDFSNPKKQFTLDQQACIEITEC